MTNQYDIVRLNTDLIEWLLADTDIAIHRIDSLVQAAEQCIAAIDENENSEETQNP